ncbi:unnamed protein product [Mytilus edulis]|uniref:Uncharacterized protein n=1 Tax=Mytilus edulis TaxID=6550 RepID=A0A8S3UWP7_MYTED|nr:unnamed protein product [Mytilus edulis]
MATEQDIHSVENSNEKDKTEKASIQIHNANPNESMTIADATENTEKTQFEKKLWEVYGLDPHYWLDILKRQLGFTSSVHLKYLKSRDLKKFESSIMNDYERDAKYKKDDTTHVKEVLDELPINKSNLEGIVQNQLSSLTPTLESGESWKAARHDCNLDNKLKNLQSSNSSNGITRTTLNDKDIISHASSGCALRGIFLNQSLDEVTEMKGIVISVVGDITLQGPSMKQAAEFVEFSSRKKSDDYQKSLQITGKKQRDIAFWGIFKWTATYICLTKSTSESNKDLVHDTLDGFINIGYAGPCPAVGIGISGKSLVNNSSITNKHSEDELSRVQLNIDSIGGPPDESEYHKWVHTLTAENKTWSLISRGNFVGIWEVLKNHQDDFWDVCKLTNLLECCWNMEIVESSHDQFKSADYELLLLTLRQTLDNLIDITGDIDYFERVVETNVKIQTFWNKLHFLKSYRIKCRPQ